ncbi:hypothetical protein PIIN_00001 [Serendipita indica DSM 11827]|uniref:Uncharacterized protein n=1 Tax=Serendipita indica (strain DSM 11827) TaxID=1109443 RepID=G4T4Z1_SERID|nr:hypothetical protein PIIN_00001 [Serendipita indica DSM 11827]
MPVVISPPLSTCSLRPTDKMPKKSLILYFYDGASDTVLGVSNCHVLCKNTNTTYEFEGDAPKRWVRVNRIRQFQQDLDNIRADIDARRVRTDIQSKTIAKLEVIETQTEQEEKELRKIQRALIDEQESIIELEALYNEVKNSWEDIGNRNIGHLRYVKASSVDSQGGTLYTEDWVHLSSLGRSSKAYLRVTTWI